MHASERPLTGIKVIEFSHMVMGPSTGLILADLGADVVKVEPPGGDKTRGLNGSGAGYYPMYNRNKRSLCADLKSDAGKGVARALIEGADVLLENFRPGAMDRLGFGWEDCHALNSRLIYCSLKGFLSGPYEHRTALDEVTQMMGGLAYMTGLPDRPLRAGSSVIDITGGMFGVIAILAALEQRHRTGEGQQVSSSLFETTAFLVGQHMAQEGVLGEPPPPMSVRRSAWSIYDIFECAGEERVFVGVVSDGLWQRFCTAFALDEFGADASLAENNARVEQRERILDTIVPMFRRMTLEQACEKLEAAGIPFAPINRPTDLFDDPHLNAGGGLLPVTVHRGERAGQSVKLPALPVEMDGERPGLYRDLPAPGSDTDAVLRDAGFSDEDIRGLRDQGVVS